MAGRREGVGPFGLKKVALADIDRYDEIFLMTFEPELDRLKGSIREIGLLEPIWLREKGQGFQIVHGFQRFDVARTLGIEEIEALIWRRADLDDRSAFLMVLHANMLGRELNLVEKALALEKLLASFSFSRDEIIRTYLPLLRLEPHENVLDSFLRIVEFDPDLKRYFLRHTLSLTNILLFAKFSVGEQESIRRFLSPLRLSESATKEVLTYLLEISLRDGIGVEGLLSCREIQGVLWNERLSGPVKNQAVRRILRAKRYPELTQIEANFTARKKEMRLPPQVSLTPPPFFEGNRFRLEFSFKNVDEFTTSLKRLQDVPEKSLEDLFSIKGYES